MFFPDLFQALTKADNGSHGNFFFLLIILIPFFEVVITGTCYLFAAMRL